METTGNTRMVIGLGGWEHDVFDQCFYPVTAASSSDKLEFYSRFFAATEVRSTFWDDTLTCDDVTGWVEAIPQRRRFSFIPKLHASITHKRALSPNTIRAMRTVLDTLHDRQRLGALLIQFPYAFTNTGANRFYLARVLDTFKGYPMHVELRHETWNVALAFDLLKSHVAAPVSADLPRVRQFAPFLTRTVGSQAYLRLHGRNEKGWLLHGHDARYDYLYNGKEIQEIRRRVQAIPRDVERVFIIWNNTTNGRAVANALQLTAALTGGRIEVPDRTLEKFPQLHDIARPVDVPPLFDGSTFREAM